MQGLQLARQLNVHLEALRNWIRQDEADRGERDDRATTIRDLGARAGVALNPPPRWRR
jgi:transposase-like protein